MRCALGLGLEDYAFVESSEGQAATDGVEFDGRAGGGDIAEFLAVVVVFGEEERTSTMTVASVNVSFSLSRNTFGVQVTSTFG